MPWKACVLLPMIEIDEEVSEDGSGKEPSMPAAGGGAAVTGEGAIWRRLRRWAQDLAVRGVRLRQSLQHAEPSRGRFASGTLSRRAFRDCLTDLGAPVRGERESTGT